MNLFKKNIAFVVSLVCCSCAVIQPSGSNLPKYWLESTAVDVIDSGSCGKNVNWELDSEGTLRIFGSGDMYDYAAEYEFGTSPFCSNHDVKNVIIEEGITSIGKGAFYLCNTLTSITIPDGVTSIGDVAFYSCKLTSLSIPNSVKTIGYSAFSGCSFISLTIPDGVAVIKDSTFYGCHSLMSVTIPDSVTTIEYGAFAFCKSLADVQYMGSEKQWNQISIKNDNDGLSSATIHYNSGKTEEENPDIDVDTLLKEKEKILLESSISDDRILTSEGIETYRFIGSELKTVRTFIADISNDGINELIAVLCSDDKTVIRKYYVAGNKIAETELGTLPTVEYCDCVDMILFYNEISGKYCLSYSKYGRQSYTGTSYFEIYLYSVNDDSIVKEKMWFWDKQLMGFDNIDSIKGELSANGLPYINVATSANVPVISYDNTSDCKSYAWLMHTDIEVTDGDGLSPASYTRYIKFASNDELNAKSRFIMDSPETPSTTTSNTTTKSTVTTTTEPINRITLGDVNEDDSVDATDASLVLYEYANLSTGGSGTFSDIQKLTGDVNSDGIIDAFDAFYIADYYISRLTGLTITLESYVSNKDDGITVPPFEKNPSNGYTEEEIENSNTKPKFTLTAEPDSTDDRIINLKIDISGAQFRWSTMGFVLDYDSKLTPVYNKFAEISMEFGNAVEYMNSYTDENKDKNQLAICAIASSEIGLDGNIVTIPFQISDDVSGINDYTFSINYNGGELFTDIKDSESARLMQAYLFTKGLDSTKITVDSGGENTDILIGDANCDGEVNIADATAIIQAIGNKDKYELSEQGEKNADCYNVGDGITGMDALAIQKLEAKIITKLPDVAK